MFAVGDDDQWIYAFRGARAGNMQDFEREFDVRDVIKLEQNYRSHSNILDAANAIIAHNQNAPGQEPVDDGRRAANRSACSRLITIRTRLGSSWTKSRRCMPRA